MQHNTLPNDIQPGEEILANRIRNTFAASVRDRVLPPADADLVRQVRAKFGTCDQLNAYRYVRTTVVETIEEWTSGECAFTKQRIQRHFSEEAVLFQVKR